MMFVCDVAEKKFDKLCDHAREAALVVSIQNVLEWDERTKMPPAGGVYRAEQAAYLAGLAHQKQTAPQVGECLDAFVLVHVKLRREPHRVSICRGVRHRRIEHIARFRGTTGKH